jgi:hypothetical protein
MSSAGSPSGTAAITATWRCWPARTSAAPGCATTGTGSGMPASPPSSGTGCVHRPRRPHRAPPAVPRRVEEGRPSPPGRAAARDLAAAGHHGRCRAGGEHEQEFFARLDQAGVLARKRYSARKSGQVTGYAVALPSETSKDGGPVWYGGGRLAADLTWPRLSQHWTRPAAAPRQRFTAAERNAIWEHAARAAADAAAQIRVLSGTDPAAADVAWAASDTLHVAAAALGSRILRQAADAYDRPARAPGERIPSPTPAGNQLRRAARLISAFACLTTDPALTPLVLITRLAALAEAGPGCGMPSRPPPPERAPSGCTPPPGTLPPRSQPQLRGPG